MLVGNRQRLVQFLLSNLELKYRNLSLRETTREMRTDSPPASKKNKSHQKKSWEIQKRKVVSVHKLQYVKINVAHDFKISIQRGNFIIFVPQTHKSRWPFQLSHSIISKLQRNQQGLTFNLQPGGQFISLPPRTCKCR